VATCQLVHRQVQSFLGDATLEVDRKEPIVASRDHVDRNRGPRIEAAAVAEDNVRLGALVCLAVLDDLGRTSWRKYVARSKSVL